MPGTVAPHYPKTPGVTSLLAVLALLLAATALPLHAEDSETKPLDALEPLVGRWISSLDETYRDHPMVQRFNPDLKPQELEVTQGLPGRALHLTIWNLDRPSAGDRTLFVEALAFWDPVAGEISYVEIGASGIVHRGTFDASDPTKLVRVFDGHFPDGTVRSFREIWRWTDPDRASFEWITHTREDGEWVAGDVIVDWARLAVN